MSFVRSLLLALFFSAVVLPAPQAQFAYEFSGPAAIRALTVTGASADFARTTEDGAKIEGVLEQLPPVRTGAAHLVLKPGRQFTTIEFRGRLRSDWTGSDRFVMHFESGSEFMMPLTLTIRDASGGTYSAANIFLVRSRNRIEIPVAELRTASGATLDLAHIASLRIDIRSAENFARDLWLYHFYLTRPDGAKLAGSLFDFGPHGAPYLAGSLPVDEQVRYTSWRGYGWTGKISGFQGWQFNKPKPDALTGSFVWSDLAGSSATFRVDLPDGRYRARFYGGNYTAKALPARSFALAVNGRTVASKKFDPDTYYTNAEFFRGIDTWYEENEDVFTKHAANAYQHYDFAFDVAGGKAEFTWSGTLAVFGLLVAPERSFDAALERTEAARREALRPNVVAPKPRVGNVAASAEEATRGFVLWTRPWEKDVAPFDIPSGSERDLSGINATAAQGQRVHGTLSLTPLRTLGEVTADVGELKNETGAVLPVEIRAVKYLWDGWPAELNLQCLFPTTHVPSVGRVNVTWWFTVSPAVGASPGTYRGSVHIRTREGGSATVPLRVRVLPFDLDPASKVSYAMWRCSDANMSYSLGPFLPGKLDKYRRLLRAELADMKAHGMTAFIFTAPSLVGVDGDRVRLDFTLTEEELRVAREFGFLDPKRPSQISLLGEVSRHLMRETRYGDFQEPEELSVQLSDSELNDEFSPRFNARFRDAVRQTQAFFDQHGVSVMFQAADEPRERNINQWNRSIADSVHYAQLIREGAPNAKVFIDSMRDDNSGVNYVPLLLKHFDVVATHPWEDSKGIYDGTRNGTPRLQYFNAIIGDRYDYGFSVAASHSLGFSQWHFQWHLMPFQPFHAESRSGDTLPGPDGPLDTPHFEMISAAVDDYRYVETLRNRIARAGKQEAGEAEADLALLLRSTHPYALRAEYAKRTQTRTTIAGRTLNEWRERLAGHILKIEHLSSN